MNAISFLARTLLVALFFGMAMGLLVKEQDPLAAVSTGLAGIVYCWPLAPVLRRRKRLYSALPGLDAFRGPGLLATARRFLGLCFALAGIGAFLDKEGNIALPIMLMGLTLTRPLDLYCFPNTSTFPNPRSFRLVTWVILRNTGIIACLSAVSDDLRPHPTGQALLAWSGIALIAAFPFFLLLTRGKQAFTPATEPAVLPASPRPASPPMSHRRVPPAPPRPKKKVPYRDAYKMRWHIKPALLNATWFNQLIRHYQSSWLEARDYDQRLTLHRSPTEFKKQILGELNDYLRQIRARPELSRLPRVLSKTERLDPAFDSLSGTVPDQIARAWKADRRLRSLFNAMQAYCALPGSKKISIILPHIAEYRAMINLAKQLTRQMEKPRFPALAEEAQSGLSFDTYHEIIDYIIQLGKNMEGYPELTDNFNEERYRDYFLPFLNSVSPHYSAKGEVFNRKGKTDILIWDKKGNNLFIAECKLWKGEVYLLSGVDQLLNNYVSWRDEKTAIIVFNHEVRNFTGLIATATTALSRHPLCVREARQRTDRSWSYLFHHPDDAQRTIRLELILLNFT